MLPGTRLEVQVFISCSQSDLGKGQGHGFFTWKPGTKQFLQFKYTVTTSTLEEETELHYTLAALELTIYKLHLIYNYPLAIIQVGVLFSHQNTQRHFHFTALMSFSSVCHPGPSSHSPCKTSPKFGNPASFLPLLLSHISL